MYSVRSLRTVRECLHLSGGLIDVTGNKPFQINLPTLTNENEDYQPGRSGWNAGCVQEMVFIAFYNTSKVKKLVR
jgi:hypothetical protein